MKKTFVYSNNINSTELLRSLSLNGSDYLGLEIFKFSNLVEDINIRLGYPIKNTLLDNDEIEKRVISFFLDDVHLPSISYQDIKHFQSTFNSIRMKIVGNEHEELNKIISNHKDIKSLTYLNEFSSSYFNVLGDDFDQIMLAHKFIEHASSKGIKLYDQVLVFDEFKLEPLEEQLLYAVSKEIKHTSVIDLFNDVHEQSEISSIMPRYGIRNEVAHVIKDIFEHNYPQDDCLIVLINSSSYTNELYKFQLEYGLKMTYECGLPLNITDAYKLYKTIQKLEKKCFFDVNGYLNLFASESLDIEKLGVLHPVQVSQIIGRMKICFDKSKNDEYLSKFNFLRNEENEIFNLFLEKIDRTIVFDEETILNEVIHVIEELSKGVAYFIRTYTKDSFNNDVLFDESRELIASTIEYADENIPEILKDSYLSQIDSKSICHNVFSDDAIHVTNINQALSTFRKHTYILGLNSANYPGSLTEDFLFSDNLYEELCGIKEITENNINFKNKYLKKVIDTYLLLGADLKLSYNAQEIKEVRELNPCSVLLDYENEYHRENDEKLSDVVKRCSYYDDGLSSLTSIVDIGIKNKKIKHEDLQVEQKKYDTIDLLTKYYSPSTLPKFLNCPLRFYLDNIACIDNTIIYDPLRPITGNRFGDLLHFVMEKYVKDFRNASLKEILEFGEKVYSLYTSFDRSIGDDNLEKKSFLQSVENTYNFLNDFDTTSSYTELKVGYGKLKEKSKIGNIYIRGSIDLVTQDKDGNYIIVDYKTGNSIEHIQDDPATCIQGLIYAQLFEKIHGKTPIKLIFFYTKFNKAITFDNPCSDEAKMLLLEKFNLFEEALKSLHFDIASKDTFKEACKYCKYENICKKNDLTKEVEVDG